MTSDILLLLFSNYLLEVGNIRNCQWLRQQNNLLLHYFLTEKLTCISFVHLWLSDN
jgi:hypothetical protein